MGDLGDQRRAVLALIAAATAARLGFAAAMGLGVDESYMVAAGRVWSWGYFDHPPAAWWLSRGSAWLFRTEAAVVVRLPFVALSAWTLWLSARLGAAAAGPRAGFWTAAVVALAPMLGVTAGTWVLPDGPMLCALAGAALCLVRALDADGRDAWRLWSGAGVCAGLAMFSKYSAVLPIAGAGLFLVAHPRHRRWLARPHPWAAAALALAGFAPVIAWNAANGWASFAFQGARAAAAAFRPLAALEMLGGGALYVLPWFFVPMLALAWRALRRGTDAERLLAALGLPAVLGFPLIAAWSGQRALPHWAAPGYLMLAPLLGAAIARSIDRRWVRAGMAASAALVLAAVAAVSAQTRWDLLAPWMPRKDPTWEGVDWTGLGDDLRARGLLGPDAVVGVPNWRDAGKIAIGLGPGVRVVCLSDDARHFAFSAPAAAVSGRPALLLAAEPPDRAARALGAALDGAVPLPPARVAPHGRTLREIAVFRTPALRWPP